MQAGEDLVDARQRILVLHHLLVQTARIYTHSPSPIFPSHYDDRGSETALAGVSRRDDAKLEPAIDLVFHVAAYGKGYRTSDRMSDRVIVVEFNAVFDNIGVADVIVIGGKCVHGSRDNAGTLVLECGKQQHAVELQFVENF